MAKKKKKKKKLKRRMDVADFIVARMEQDQRVGLKTLEMMGQGCKVLLETIVQPVLPVLIERMRAENKALVINAKANHKVAMAQMKAVQKGVPVLTRPDNGAQY